MTDKGEKRMDNGGSVEIRLYRDGDGGKLNDLFNHVFRERRSLDGWDWKFRKNPVLNYLHISLALKENGRLVGMYPVLPAEFKVKDGLVLAVQPVEIAIHPDFRGRWIVSQLKSFLTQTTDVHYPGFGFGFPTRKHAKLGARFMSYHIIGELPIMGITVGRGFRFGTTLFGKVFRKLLYLPHFIYYYLRVAVWARGEGKNSSLFRTAEIDRFDEDFDRIWENISKAYPVVSHRTSRYLNWRYVENPMAEFTRLEAREGGKLKGYMVYTILAEGGKKGGIIFDFFYPEGEPGGKLLLKEGLMCLLRKRVDTVRCGALPHTSIYRHLSSLGFKKWLSSPLVNLEIFDNGLDQDVLGDLSHWYLSIGDTDLMGW